MDNIKFQDVGIVSFDTNTGTKLVYGLTDSTSINHIVNSTELRTGIGNVYLGEVWESKNLEISVTPTINNFSLMAVQTKNGDAMSTSTVEVPYVLKLEAEDDGSGGAEIDLSDYTPVDDEVTVVDINNETVTSTFATGTVTLTSGTVGQIYYVTFMQSETTADVLDIDGADFPETVENLTVQTIGYNIETGALAGRLFIMCDRAQPMGSFTLDLQKATNSNQETMFKAVPKPLGTRLAKVVWVPAT